MDNIISDLEFLYDYISAELNKRNIILLNQSSLTVVDNDTINRLKNKNIKAIRNWIRGLRLTEKKQLITMIKQTKKNYDLKKNALSKDITFRKIYLRIFLVILIIAVIIVMLFKVVIYTDTPGVDREPWENFATFIIILIDVLILLINSLRGQIKQEDAKNDKLKALNNNINKAFGYFDISTLTPANLVDKLGGIVDENENDAVYGAQPGSIITFINDYEEQVSKLKFGDFIKFTLVDQISYFFSEQQDLVYKKTTDSVVNAKLFNEFIDTIFSKKMILEQITLINQNLVVYNIEIIPNQDILVNDFFEILQSDNMINEDSIQLNKIYIIIKRLLINLIKYYNVTNIQVLSKIKTKIDQIKKTTLKDIDTEIVFDNYTKIINLLYQNIEEENKKDSYMATIKGIPPRFTKVGNFTEFYKKLSIEHLQSIRTSASDTIVKINKLLTDYKAETEKEFNDNKNSTYQLGVIAISVIIISAIHLKKYIYKDVDRPITRTSSLTSELPSTAQNVFRSLERSGNYIMNGINIYSIWFFFSVTILSYWYKKNLANKLNFSEYASNTTDIITKLTEVISKIDDLIIVRKYVADNSTYNYQMLTQTNDMEAILTEKKSLLDKFGYKFVPVDEKKEIKNIVKLGSDNMYYLWDFDKIESEMCSLIYHDYVIVMENYECCNFINIKAEVPFPVTEIILDAVFLGVTILVFFLILQRLNPISLMTDLNKLQECSTNKTEIVNKLKADINNINIKEKTGNEDEDRLIDRNIELKHSLLEELKETKEFYNEDKLSNECMALIDEYKDQDISKAKTFMTISIFYTTMYLSFKIISSSYSV